MAGVSRTSVQGLTGPPSPSFAPQKRGAQECFGRGKTPREGGCPRRDGPLLEVTTASLLFHMCWRRGTGEEGDRRGGGQEGPSSSSGIHWVTQRGRRGTKPHSQEQISSLACVLLSALCLNLGPLWAALSSELLVTLA